MSPLFSKIRDLNTTHVTAALKVRVGRCYRLHVGDDTSNVYAIELLLYDSDGGRTTVKRALVPRFQDMFREDHLYAIKNFVVDFNNMKMKTTDNHYKLILISRTNVAEIFDPHFPRHVFDFKTYDDLSAWENVDESLLIDVIGRLSSRSNKQTREVQGRETSMMDITLKNLQGSILPCTVWGVYADELSNYVDLHDGPIVIIMQLCRVRKYRGEFRVTNYFNVSKVLFNDNVREIDDFRRGMVNEGDLVIPVYNLGMPSRVTIREELESSRDKILTLDWLIRVHDIEYFWVFCKIVAIEPMFSWFYVSCKKCLRKMTPAGPTFYCVECDQSDPTGNLRYRVQVRVADSRGQASFLLWDKECLFLIGKSAGDLCATSNGKVVPEKLHDP